jgi:hypothetical protein
MQETVTTPAEPRPSSLKALRLRRFQDPVLLIPIEIPPNPIYA